MSGLQTLVTVAKRDAAALRAMPRAMTDPTPANRGTEDADAPAAAPCGMVERGRRALDLHGRWVALTGRPGDDLDPDSAEGAVAIALRDRLEVDLRWLEGHAPHTAAEAEAKLAVAVALAGHAGEADARYLAFLARARAERAGFAARATPPRAPLLSTRALLGAVGLRR